jgi:phosphoribosylformylglycinamidine synthase
MISESQERMLVITNKRKLPKLKQICAKFRISCSIIGHVTNDKMMHVKKGQKTLALLPANFVARAPLLDRKKTKPKYLREIKFEMEIKKAMNYSEIILKLLSSPNIASKHWVFQQYDHEVGIRTVVKPGFDASVLRLDNGKFLSTKIDGNPKHCYIDPRQGAIGCFEEACRNVICTGANPIGMVDHLQFGNPENPEVFWTFMESIEGLADFAKFLRVPCVGGKVSFYNETKLGPIKPTPLIGVLGIIDSIPLTITPPNHGDYLVIIGKTKDELGGSEYYEYIHKFIGGHCPTVNFKDSKINMLTVLSLIKNKLVKSVHDCSKGGAAIAISELSIFGNIGCDINIEELLYKNDISIEKLLFSESHSRYLLVIDKKNIGQVKQFLLKKKTTFAILGKFSGDQIQFKHKSKYLVKFTVDIAQKKYFNTLEELLKNG